MINKSPIYLKMEERWQQGAPAVMDGGIGSELQAMGYPPADSERPLNFTWGTLALYDAPETVKAMHRRYVEAGADILLTDTFQFLRCVRMEQDGDLDVPPGNWHEIARRSVRLAREAAVEGARPDTAVAFCMMVQDSPKEEWGDNRSGGKRSSKNWDVLATPEYLRELGEALQGEPPDALLVELAPPIPDDLSFPLFETLVSTGFPVWIAYRRGVGGPIGIFGDAETPDGDLLGRAAQRFEQMGVAGLLVHCLPPEKAHGVAAWLRQFTSLPLGVYPNNGRYDQYKWRWEHTISAEEFAEHARGYAAEGMNIIGGCCGVRPEHIAAVTAALKGQPA